MIIPACNEAAVLPGSLAGLLAQDLDVPMRVIVVCNGCTDATAQVARSAAPSFRASGHTLTVLELPTGGKAAALDAGDSVADDRGVRVYLDADIVVSPNAISEVHRVLSSGSGIHLASPRIRIKEAASWVTTCYGRVWSSLPYICQDVVGCGFYAVSEEGRRRWDTFPRIISDDKFVRLQFGSHERAVVSTASFVIRMPEGLRELVSVRGRWCRGNRELAREFPALAARDHRRYPEFVSFVLTHPAVWIHVPLFLFVFVLGEFAAFRRRKVGIGLWERAELARSRGGPG